MEEDLKVVISRSHGTDQKCSEISISEILEVEWSNISGGVQRRQSGYSLYGFIPYATAMKLVNCSGEHEKYGSNARVLIRRPDSDKYKPGYQILMRQAGPKPHSNISKERPSGQQPCTKAILSLLPSEGFQTRGNIRNELYSIGYKKSTVTNAFRTLIKNEKIHCTGSSNSKYQKIFLNKS